MNASSRLKVCRAADLALFDSLESRTLLSGVWEIAGTPARDTIIVRLNAANDQLIEAVVNGHVVQTRAHNSIDGIRVLGGLGNDNIDINIGPDGDIPTTLYGGSGNDTISGGSGRDLIRGNWGNDDLSGDIGNDRIFGDVGNDELTGDEGYDRLYGDAGQDTLAGGLDRDDLFGGTESDQLSGGYGKDVLNGDSGNDTLFGGIGSDSLIGGSGRDTYHRRRNDVIRIGVGDVQKSEQQGNPLSAVGDREEFKDWLVEQAVANWQWAFGQTTSPWYRWGYSGGSAGFEVALASDSVASGNAAGAAPDPGGYSETNTQEQGVDEADIVETNGQYIYLARDSELIIIDAWPADQAREVSRVTIDGNIRGIYLAGGKVTVVSTKWDYGNWSPGRPGLMMTDIMPYWSEAETTVSVVDITNPAAPEIAEKLSIEGSYASSRMIDGRLYVVTDSNLDKLHPLTVEDDDPDTSWEEYRYETEAEYRARLGAVTVDGLMPGYTSTVGGQTAASGALGEDELYAPVYDFNFQDLFSVSLIDVTDDQAGVDASTAVFGFSGQVYASADNLYVMSQGWDAPMGGWQGDARTDLYKFALGTDSVSLAGTGEVPGYVLNQFAASEHNGYFRIATTTRNGGTSNNVFVLDDQGERLEVYGSITGIAFNEQIYAARFVEDRGYLVTFRRVDPLFTLDLSDPANPEVAGELKIPGYSSYLHPISGNRLIGFGRNATESGQVLGLQVSLFDVSDIANPVRQDVYNVPVEGDSGWWGGTSSAEWDHHAFNYFADRELITVPVLDYGYWHGDARLEIISIDEGLGLRKFGEVKHDTEVLRSVRIGDYLYSIARNDMIVVEFADTNNEQAHVIFDDTPVTPPEVDILVG